jgi:hypothetical protein
LADARYLQLIHFDVFAFDMQPAQHQYSSSKLDLRKDGQRTDGAFNSCEDDVRFLVDENDHTATARI